MIDYRGQHWGSLERNITHRVEGAAKREAARTVTEYPSAQGHPGASTGRQVMLESTPVVRPELGAAEKAKLANVRVQHLGVGEPLSVL